LLYGNIGGGGRLDFTCIGPAINLASRLEKLTGAQGRSIIASRDFAVHCGGSFLPLGEFALPGFHEKQLLYGLSDEVPRGIHLGVSDPAETTLNEASS
jgi:adenylate cyclase